MFHFRSELSYQKISLFPHTNSTWFYFLDHLHILNIMEHGLYLHISLLSYICIATCPCRPKPNTPPLSNLFRIGFLWSHEADDQTTTWRHHKHPKKNTRQLGDTDSYTQPTIKSSIFRGYVGFFGNMIKLLVVEPIHLKNMSQISKIFPRDPGWK